MKGEKKSEKGDHKHVWHCVYPLCRVPTTSEAPLVATGKFIHFLCHQYTSPARDIEKIPPAFIQKNTHTHFVKPKHVDINSVRNVRNTGLRFEIHSRYSPNALCVALAENEGLVDANIFRSVAPLKTIEVTTADLGKSNARCSIFFCKSIFWSRLHWQALTRDYASLRRIHSGIQVNGAIGNY